MTQEIKKPPPREAEEKTAPIERLFFDLSTPETAVNVTPDRVESLRDKMSRELEAVGIDLAVLQQPEQRARLRERRFRRLDQGKGLAVSAAMRGALVLYQNWAQSESVDLPKLKRGDDSSRGRGLMQLLANTLAFASGAITAADYLKDVKWRVGASYERSLNETERTQKIRKAFGIPDPKDPQRRDYNGYSRIKPQSLKNFWGTLKDLCYLK